MKSITGYSVFYFVFSLAYSYHLAYFEAVLYLINEIDYEFCFISAQFMVNKWHFLTASLVLGLAAR